MSPPRSSRRFRTCVLTAKLIEGTRPRSSGSVAEKFLLWTAARAAVEETANTDALGEFKLRERSPLPDGEWCAVGPTEWYARGDRLNRLEISAALSFVVARVDERDRSLNQLHDRHISWRADLQRAHFRHPIDDLCGIDRRHGHDLLEREAKSEKLAH